MDPEPTTAGGAERIVQLLSGSSSEQMDSGFKELATLLAPQVERPTRDVDLEVAEVAIACIAPLIDIMADASTELPAFKRAALALCTVRDVDRCEPGSVGAAVARPAPGSSSPHVIAVWTACGGLVDKMLQRPPEELTADDALVAICSVAPFVMWGAAGIDRAGCSMDTFASIFPANWFLAGGTRQSNERNLALAPLLMELLRGTGTSMLDERLLAIAHYSLAMLLCGRGDVALRLEEAGLFEHLVECLKADNDPGKRFQKSYLGQSAFLLVAADSLC
jgi:hypothetical protein